MNHECQEAFEPNGKQENDGETIKVYGSCNICGRDLIALYDYNGLYDKKHDTFL